MDRRVVAGIVGVVLAGAAQAGRAQVGPDPSGMPPVGLSPVPSLGDTINGSSRSPGMAPPPRYAGPTDPQGGGPAATVPAAPDQSAPVSIRTEPPIGQALRSGYRTGPISSIFRGYRPAAGQPAPNAARPAPAPPRLSATRSAAASAAGRRAEPPPISYTPMGDPGVAIASPDGRPAPYAGRAPEIPRPQLDPAAEPAAGRPAPLSDEQSRSARPRSVASRTPSYRPAEAPGPAPVPTPAPAPLEVPPAGLSPSPTPPTEPPPSTAGTGPAPVLEPLPTIPPPELTPAPAASAAITAPPPASDPEVRRVSEDVTAIRLKAEPPRELPFATLRAAAVGDEIITLEELNAVVAQRLEEMKGAGPMSDEERRQVVNMIASQSLDHMIDQAVILQEAGRQMRGPKFQVMFNEYVDKNWREKELPPLLRKTVSANEYELKRKLSEQGKSYDAMKEAFRKKSLAQDFMSSKIHAKVTCDLSEQRAYYNDHIKEYEQPARFSWREIEVSFAKHPTRAEARARADSILARLLRNEDFAEVARSASDGPTASKGGLYPDMTPGSYGIPVVNDELNRLPIGQISTILEAPGAFHIVRVESRREAGPLRFDEVQDRIRPKVLERNYQRAVENYLSKLREKTLIRTMFDNSDSDPRLARRNDPSVQPAANR